MAVYCFSSLWFRTRPPPTGVRITKSGNEGFGVKKLPFPSAPEKGALSQKFPHFPCGALYRNGDLLTQSALFWHWEMGLFGTFLTPKPSFPDFGDFDPFRGRTRSQPRREKQAGAGADIHDLKAQTSVTLEWLKILVHRDGAPGILRHRKTSLRLRNPGFRNQKPRVFINCHPPLPPPKNPLKTLPSLYGNV